MKNPGIFRETTRRQNIDRALAELAETTKPKEAKFSICFISPSFDREILALKIPQILGNKVYGCTPAGEIGPEGFTDQYIERAQQGFKSIPLLGGSAGDRLVFILTENNLAPFTLIRR